MDICLRFLLGGIWGGFREGCRTCIEGTKPILNLVTGITSYVNLSRSKFILGES